MVAEKDEELTEGWKTVTEAVLNENLLTVFNTIKDKAEGLVMLDEGCCMVSEEESNYHNLPHPTLAPHCHPHHPTSIPDSQCPHLTWTPHCQLPHITWTPQCQPLTLR